MTKNDLIDCLSAWDKYRGIPVEGSDFFLSWEDKNLKAVSEYHGKECYISAVMGSRVDIETLSDNQTTCSGDGKYYYFLLTKKEQKDG